MTASEPTTVLEPITVLEPTAEVRRFVTAVRSRLCDLTEEEREELVGGLDADMADLVAERGVAALPDPVGYAEELRSAAGFPPMRRRREGLPGSGSLPGSTEDRRPGTGGSTQATTSGCRPSRIRCARRGGCCVPCARRRW